MAENERNGGRFGFIRSLFEKKNTAAEEKPIEKEVVAEKIVQDEEKAARIEAASLKMPEGSLAELWRRWSGKKDPLVLSLLGNGNGCEVSLSDKEMVAERLRLAAKIERDAKEFLKAMDHYEAKKLRLEAKRALQESQTGDDAAKAQPSAEEEKIEEIKPFCNAYMSTNGMAAWLLLIAPSNPEDRVDKRTIEAVLAENKIVFGIDPKIVEYVAEENPYFALIPVAGGTPVQPGENGRIIEHFQRQIEASVKVDSDGIADYRAINYIQSVKEDDVICDIVPPKPGVAGMRVDGAVAEPAPVKSAIVPAGKHTKISEEGDKLLAAKTGHVEYDGSKFFIKVLLDVPGNVDYGTGNLDYDGDIHIHGDVRATFSVKATGNIIIDGLVEAANVEAGGDVLVSCGVLGDDNAQVICGGDLRAKYLESCTAYVGKSVFADCIMSSQVYCDDTIEVLSGRGAIIGGSLVAGNRIKSKAIGTDSGRKTELELGTVTYIKMKHSEEIEELKKAMAELTRLNRDIAFLEKKQKLQEKQGDDPDDAGDQRLAAALLSKNAICARIEELTKVQKELEEKKPDLAKCRLESSVVYPPTMLMIGGAIWKFEEIKNNCAGWLDKEIGEINIT